MKEYQVLHFTQVRTVQQPGIPMGRSGGTPPPIVSVDVEATAPLLEEFLNQQALQGWELKLIYELGGRLVIFERDRG
jgi:hypothetical protein